MQTKETTFLINYKPILIGCLVYLSMFLFPISSIDNLDVMLLPIGLMVFVFYAITQNLLYYKIKISDNEVKVTPWFADEILLFTKEQIKSVTIRKDDSISTNEIIVVTPEGNKSHYINTFAYITKGKSRKDSIKYMNYLFESMVDVQQHSDAITKIETNKLTETKFGSSLRFFVYPALLLFIAMLYVDMKIISGVHFDTMNFLLPQVGIVLSTVGLCFLALKLQKSDYSFVTSCVVGVILGLIITSCAKSYIHWTNENKGIEIVKYYPMKLDDYDSHSNKQRWIVESKEAEALIGQKRLFFYGNQHDRMMNTKLVEEKTYSIPVAVGKFNDVFIPQDGFLKVKEIND